MSSTWEYAEWRAILRRSKTRAFVEQGLEIEAAWQHDFARFLADAGVCPVPGGRLARINPTEGYVAANVHWVAEQDAEQRANAHLITIDGRTASLAEWARAAGLRSQTLRHRLELGWSIAEALGESALTNPNPISVATAFVTHPTTIAAGAIPCHSNTN